ncbi:hypothetical protein JEZ13_11055 [bacterium]|nr:hypothetical protein [bacterium]
MKLVWLLWLLIFNISLFADVYLSSDADRAGLANLSIISKSPITSYYQASITNEGLSCSISQPYQFSGIENGNIAISKNVKNFNLSLGSLYLMSNYYNQFSNYLNLSYTFHDVITWGIGQKLISVYEEENYYYTTTDIGFLISQNKTKLAVSYTNLFKRKSSKLTLPNIISTEISYNPIPDVYLALGLEKEKNFKTCPKIAIRYKVLKSLTLLSGYSLEPNQISFGISVNYYKCFINYAIMTHPQLDSTHYITLIYGL